MLLIGSAALQVVKPQILKRKPRDLDFIVTPEELQTSFDSKSLKRLKEDKYLYAKYEFPIELEVAIPGSSGADLLQLVKEDPNTIHTPKYAISSLDMLFTIKKSHRFLKNSPHFWKNLLDYHSMKTVGARVRPEWKAFLKKREKETYNYAHPKLNVSKEDFFAAGQVEYTYDHDSIHRAIAIDEEPAYRNFMVDGAEVQCSRKKFRSQSMAIKLNSYVEEAGVLAIERSLVPFPGHMTPKQAWRFALSKALTSITSGWWRTWGYENAFDILKQYDEQFYSKFLEGVKSGVVIPLKVA